MGGFSSFFNPTGSATSSGFFSALFGGKNPTLEADMARFGQIGGFATNLGESNLSEASNFWSSLLSGDQARQAQVLAPEIATMQQQTQQARNAAAQFGNRGGGMNAAMQAAGAQSRGAYNNLVASLLGASAQNLGSLGSSLLGTGLQAYGQQLAASQQQMANWANSILGHALISGVQTAEEAGEMRATGQTQASSQYGQFGQ